MTFEEKYNNLARSSCKWYIFPWKLKYFVKLIEKIEIFGNFLGKVEIFLLNCLKKSKFF